VKQTLNINNHNKFEEILAVLIVKHKYLGWIFRPCILKRDVSKDFYEPEEYIFNNTEHNNVIDDFAQIVKIASAYDEQNILKIFSKKKQFAKDFFSNLDESIEENIRQFVEKNLIKIIDILLKQTISIYIQHDRANLYSEDLINIVTTPSDVIFNFSKYDNNLEYNLSINIEGNDTKLLGKSHIVLSNSPSRIVIDNKLMLFNDIDSKKLVPFFSKKHITIPERIQEQYFKGFILNAIKKFDVKAKGFEIEDVYPIPTIELCLDHNITLKPAFSLKFSYDKINFNSTKLNYKVEMLQNNNTFSYQRTHRNIKIEQKILNTLFELGLGYDNYNMLTIKSDKEDLKEQDYLKWISNNKKIISHSNISIIFSNKEVSSGKSTLELSFVQTNNDWFDVDAVVKFDEFDIPFKEIRNYIVNNTHYFELPNGKIAIIPDEWFAEYQNIFLLLKEEQKMLKMNKLHFNVLENIEMGGLENEHLLNRFNNYNDFQVQYPKEVKAELRPYQLQAYRWLMFLKQHKLGGCLADDMGLGKTLQTLCLLNEASKDRFERNSNIKKQIQLSIFDNENKIEKNCEKKASLIVLPSSLVHNWYNEIQKFTPHLKVLQHIGAGRDISNTHFSDYDIILTTYGLVRNDINVFEDYLFNYLILDESQVIKNTSSKIYKAIMKLDSIHKLAVTGTPIENNLAELWVQMNFVNDGILGSLKFFAENYIKPIEMGDIDVANSLKTIIKPFILRRLKSEVAKDLPELTEQIIYCEMTTEQETFYEEEKSKVRNFIYEIKDNNEIKHKSAHILQALTKLRQIANHPIMIDKTVNTSGKFEEICRVIDNITSENHKMLIFSSFVKHLELVEKYLNDSKIGYSKLTGSSTNREDIIKEFETDSDKKVFLISIKSGGVGLNLTCADYVLILDPWWNPAIESQAISRSHRIGQKNNVFVYRFISEKTIEEKIKILQEKKKNLAESFIETEKIIFDDQMLNILFE
jgi:SNF2 family DNA or RNA helicase